MTTTFRSRDIAYVVAFAVVAHVGAFALALSYATA